MRLLQGCLLLVICLSMAQAAEKRLFARSATGQWLPLACQYDARAGMLRFTVDPAAVRSAETTVVVDPKPGVVLADYEAPRIIGLKIDGRPYSITPWPLDLDWLPQHPDRIRLAFRDRHNALDRRTLQVSLNGRPLDTAACAAVGVERTDGPGITWVDLTLGPWLHQPGPLTRTLAVSIADVSPQQNRVAMSLRYSCLLEPDIERDPTVLTDSAHAGYEDLSVLTDGKIMTPGQTTYGVTWASREEAGDHWVVMAWPRPRAVQTVTIHWAHYAGTFWAASRLLVQTWENDRWVTRQTRDRTPSEASTRVDLGGVTTTRLRLLQPDGQGNVGRPHIMWITELTVE